jgi:thiaminase
MSFTRELWQAIEPIYAQILAHPFNQNWRQAHWHKRNFSSTSSKMRST